MEDQRLERLVVVAALLAAREELAVGEGSRAALAEGVVRIGVDRSVAVNLCDVALAGRDVAPAFENHRLQPQLDEVQRGEEAGRARAYDKHLRTAGHRGVVEVHGCGQRLAVDVDLERQVDFGLPLAGVNRTLDDTHEGHLVGGKAETTRGERIAQAGIRRLFGRKDKGNNLRHNDSVGGHKNSEKKAETVAPDWDL